MLFFGDLFLFVYKEIRSSEKIETDYTKEVIDSI